MDKEQIVNEANIMAKACLDAQSWIERNEERVRSCAKNKDVVLADLRRQCRLFKKLGRAAGRKMCAGVFGPSQAGKSYLLSSLARDENGAVLCNFNGKQCDFLRDINPEGGKESTGLVTRFTMTAPTGYPDNYPVYVSLLTECELVKIFANTYFCDAKHMEEVDKDAIRNALAPLMSRANSSCNHITLDVMEDLHEYISNSFRDKTRAAALDEVYWNDAIALAPKLSKDDRVTLYSIIWNGVDEFTDMLRALITELEKIDFADELFCSMDSLIPRGASIIDVETLGKTDFSEFNAAPSVNVKTRSGKIADISRKNLTAIVAELTLVMVHKPANYFDHTDLLDFPGYKARLEATNLRDYLHSDKADSAVEQFFRRGKVAYLFQRYNAERELTSLLLCNSTTDNIPSLPAAVEDWIIATHGKTPEERVNVKNALFYILTKSDQTFDWGPGKSYQSIWHSTIKGKFLDHFSNTFSQTTKWVERWTPTQPFNNMFMLRNINIQWDAMLQFDSGNPPREVGILPNKQEHYENMKKAFLESDTVKKHFRSPETSFDELMKLNDGGIEHIKRCLEPLCDPTLKLNQISNALLRAEETLVTYLSPFYHSGNQAEEIKKKQALFMRIKNFSSNPKFRARFPELLNSFSVPVDQLVYLKDDADRKYEEYKEKFNSIPMDETPINQDNLEEPMEMDMSFELNPDSFFGTTSDSKVNGDNSTELTAEKDAISFYVDRIISVWSSRNHSKAEGTESTGYYLFPQQAFSMMLDEFDIAIERLNIRKKIEDKFREIARFTGEEYQKSRRQASYAMNVLNNFVSYLGKVPGERNIIDFNGKDVPVFKKVEDIDDYPNLPFNYDRQANAKQWFMDWLVTFYGMLVDNAVSDSTGKFDIQENIKLGEIIKTIKKE